MITLILARSNNNVIGLKGKLPWRMPSDLKHFKNMTMGKTLVMGRKTYDALPKLKGRNIIVMTRDPDLRIDGVTTVTSIENIKLIAEHEEIFIAGGSEIYDLFIPICDRIHLSEIDFDVDGDAFGPEINEGEFTEVNVFEFCKTDKDQFEGRVRVLDRKQKHKIKYEE